MPGSRQKIILQDAKAQFTIYLFASRMGLGPRSPRNAFGAARHTMPFDRVNGDKYAKGQSNF
jgi:hypothetical protein